MSRWGLGWAVPAALLGQALVATAAEVTHSQIERTPAKETRLSPTEAARAELWGLNETEWRRYLSLMQGIRGSISPGTISPIEVLGIHARDEAEHSQVCVIGEGVRRELFGWEEAIGRTLKVNDLWLEVVGVLAGSGGASSVQGVAVGSTDLDIYLPVSTALRKLDLPLLEAPLDEIIVRLAAGASPTEVAKRIEQLVDRLHGGESDFELVVPEALLEQSRRTQRLFNIVMGAIAGISLLVGGIGIANIMLATVFERTREIGIRRAVGARRVDIRTLFLMESVSISVLGGLIGVAAGVAIAKVVAVSAGWSTVVTAWSVLLAFGVSMAVGIGSGLYPALRAANLNPIDALRWE